MATLKNKSTKKRRTANQKSRVSRSPTGKAYTQRRYSDAERVAALELVMANGGAVAPVAEQLGIPESTLKCWKNGWRHPEAWQYAISGKGGLSHACRETAWLLLQSAAGKIAKAPLGSVLNGTETMIKLARLLSGESTENIQTHNTTVAVTADMADLIEKMNHDEREQFERLYQSVQGRIAGTGEAGDPGGEPEGRPEEPLPLHPDVLPPVGPEPGEHV